MKKDLGDDCKENFECKNNLGLLCMSEKCNCMPLMYWSGAKCGNIIIFRFLLIFILSSCCDYLDFKLAETEVCTGSDCQNYAGLSCTGGFCRYF